MAVFFIWQLNKGNLQKKHDWLEKELWAGGAAVGGQSWPRSEPRMAEVTWQN